MAEMMKKRTGNYKAEWSEDALIILEEFATAKVQLSHLGHQSRLTTYFCFVRVGTEFDVLCLWLVLKRCDCAIWIAA